VIFGNRTVSKINTNVVETKRVDEIMTDFYAAPAENANT